MCKFISNDPKLLGAMAWLFNGSRAMVAPVDPDAEKVQFMLGGEVEIDFDKTVIQSAGSDFYRIPSFKYKDNICYMNGVAVLEFTQAGQAKAMIWNAADLVDPSEDADVPFTIFAEAYRRIERAVYFGIYNEVTGTFSDTMDEDQTMHRTNSLAVISRRLKFAAKGGDLYTRSYHEYQALLDMADTALVTPLRDITPEERERFIEAGDLETTQLPDHDKAYWHVKVDNVHVEISRDFLRDLTLSM